MYTYNYVQNYCLLKYKAIADSYFRLFIFTWLGWNL